MHKNGIPRGPAAILSLVLAAAIHVDWHLARPHEHRLSLEWSNHWIATAAVFLIAGCVIARLWPQHRWTLAAIAWLGAALVGQVVEPVLESVLYAGRLGYDVEPARWTAFWQAITAGGVALVVGLFCAARRVSLRAS
jgi:hypothetical protein